ncbi:hypothetical protein IW148_000401 [Coemansia sp. RSA 1199]|nr:hypothetical protein IW148_000401 [Coemansia sp. RSA 1199]
MIVVVCDLFDIPGSLILHLGDIIGAQHPVVLVVNRADLLPKDYHEQCLLMWFKCFVKSLKLNIQAIHLVLALKNLGADRHTRCWRRIDLVEGPSRIFVTIYSTIRPHFTRIKRADDLIQHMQAGEKTILQPPVGDAE